MRRVLLGSGLFLVLAMAVPACGGDSAGAPDAGGPGFAMVEALFNSATGLCSGCHVGAEAELPGLMNLTTGNAYDSIVNVDSIQCASMGGRKRVVPGMPDQSYLLDKLKGVRLCSGLQMPYGLGPLPAAEIAKVEDWIRGGANR